MHYKAPDNSLHFLNDDSFSYLLPPGSVPISDSEAEALQPKPDTSTIRVSEIDAQITTLESKSHRAVRASLESLLAGTPPDPVDVLKLQAISTQIDALREERKKLAN
jgi:hypothetical protein